MTNTVIEKRNNKKLISIGDEASSIFFEYSKNHNIENEIDYSFFFFGQEDFELCILPESKKFNVSPKELNERKNSLEPINNTLEDKIKKSLSNIIELFLFSINPNNFELTLLSFIAHIASSLEIKTTLISLENTNNISLAIAGLKNIKRLNIDNTYSNEDINEVLNSCMFKQI